MAMSICLVSICIFFVHNLQFSYGQHECPINEVAVACVDSCNTCDSTGPPCPLMCIPGCDCIPGYARNSLGTCIPWAYCSDESPYSIGEDDIRICPDTARCDRICKRRGLSGGSCRGLTGRTCHCFNRSQPGVIERPPSSPVVADDDQDDDGNDYEFVYGIDGRRRKRKCRKRCIGKKKRKRHSCKCIGIKTG